MNNKIFSEESSVSQLLHNIRNSLNSILGYSQILQEEKDISDNHIKMVVAIEKAALNIESLLSTKIEPSINHKKMPTEIAKEPTVLIVDDNEDNRAVLGLILKKYNIKLLYAKGGLESIEIAIEHKPDLIFMDFNMPDINGDIASQRIKEKLLNTKIVALSGDIDLINNNKNKKIFDYLIEKPFNRSEIRDIISRFTPATIQKNVTSTHLSQEFLTELIDYAKAGRISSMEKLVDSCQDKSVQQYLREKILAFDFEKIILWADQ